MSRFHLHDERNIMKLCFGSIVRESISNVVATANKLRASIHPSIQQPNMKPSQLCLSPLRTRFTFCLNLPDPKVSKMEDLACSFLHFFHPLDHTFWSLLTGQFGRFTMQRYMLRTESRSLARTHQIPTMPKQKRCIRQLRCSVISVERGHPIFQTHDHQSQITTCSICGQRLDQTDVSMYPDRHQWLKLTARFTPEKWCFGNYFLFLGFGPFSGASWTVSFREGDWCSCNDAKEVTWRFIRLDDFGHQLKFSIVDGACLEVQDT